MLRSKDLDNYNHALFLSNFYMVVVQKFVLGYCSSPDSHTLMCFLPHSALYVEAHSALAGAL